MGFIRGKKLFAVIAMAWLLVANVPLVQAADTAPAGQGIQVSNVLIDLNAEKGKTYNLKLTVTNVTAGTLTVKSDVNDFKAKDETGTPQVILDSSNEDSSYSLRTWVSVLPSVTLKSKESRTLGFGVAVPQNAEAGGHYGVIRFSGLPPEVGNKNVALVASVGVLVLTRVEGKITEQLKLEDMFVYQGNKKRSLVEKTPLTLVSRVTNTGNVHVKPIGHLVVKNFFGKPVATLDFGDKNKNVLPNSTRRFEQQLHNKWLFGRYTMSVDAAYGTSGKVLTGNASFWVIPYKLILVVLVLLLVAFVFIRRGLRRYHDRILRKAGHNRSRGR